VLASGKRRVKLLNGALATFSWFGQIALRLTNCMEMFAPADGWAKSFWPTGVGSFRLGPFVGQKLQVACDLCTDSLWCVSGPFIYEFCFALARIASVNKCRSMLQIMVFILGCWPTSIRLLAFSALWLIKTQRKLFGSNWYTVHSTQTHSRWHGHKHTHAKGTHPGYSKCREQRNNIIIVCAHTPTHSKCIS